MKVGDLIYDIPAKEYGIILELNPEWLDGEGCRCIWDFRVYSDGDIFFMDRDEIKKIEIFNDDNS